jgi:16S rRNA (uracil1498-N3)-methyltransferase
VPARVLAPDAAAVGQTVALSADEAAHVARVLRLGAGDVLRVFDGRGREWEARIVQAGRDGVAVVVDVPVAPAAETQVRYTVATAVLKGDGTDEAVRDAVMMGAARLRPFVAARSDVRLSAIARGDRRARWQRIAVASAKQCGRAVVPAIDAPVSLEAVLADAADSLRLLLVEPAHHAPAVPPAALPAPAAATLAIGPEGGWTADELAAAIARGWQPVHLGPRTLRATSMAIAALAACQAVWEGS